MDLQCFEPAIGLAQNEISPNPDQNAQQWQLHEYGSHSGSADRCRMLKYQ
jgi:hypothetical protein